MKKKTSIMDYIFKHPILSMIMLLSICSLSILVVSVVSAQSEENKRIKRQQNKVKQEQEKPSEVRFDNEIIAVIKAIDLDEKTVTLIRVNDDEEQTFFYTGGTDIRDKFGRVIAASQLELGQIVEAGYVRQEQKLIKLYLSKDAFEYQKLDHLSIDKTEKSIRVATTRFQYDKNLLVVKNGALGELYEVHELDEVMIRGYDTKICSITITKGHGTIKLIDDEEFIGGNVSVGTAVFDEITEGMVLTVREGNYNITVENGSYSGTKNITVHSDTETEVSIGDFGPDAIKMGKVKFDIHPFGADLFIDGELMSYKAEQELRYGEHSIVVSLGGYVTFEGNFVIEASSKEIRVDLIEGTGTTSEGSTGTSGNNSGDITDGENGSETLGGSSGSHVDTLPGSDDTSASEDYTVDRDHFIYIQNPEGASVYLNGVYKITSPGSFEKVIGTHYITFIKDGYETKSYTIEVVDDDLDAYFNFPDLGETVE